MNFMLWYFDEVFYTMHHVSTYCVGQSSGSLDHVFDSYNAIRNIVFAGQPVAVILNFSQSISQVGEEFDQFIHWQENQGLPKSMHISNVFSQFSSCTDTPVK